MAARTLNKLTAIQVGKLAATGRHSDGGGLYLFIDDTSRRRWIFMYTRHGRRSELGLGSGRDMNLAAARTEAAALRAILAAGGDPKAERDKLKGVPSFGDFSDAYVEAMAPSWRNPKHAAQWKMTLTVYAQPLRHRPVDEITTSEVLKVLEPLWKRTPETAERLRGRIENVLNAAKAKGYRSGENPALWRGHLDQLLPKRQRLSRGHHAALIAAVAEFERDLLIERTQAGLSRAKASGKASGRPQALSTEQQRIIVRRRKEGTSLGILASEFKVSRAAIQRIEKRELSQSSN